MRALRLIFAAELFPIVVGTLLLVTGVTLGEDLAIIVALPVVALNLIARPVLFRALSSGRLADPAGLAVRYVDSEIRSRVEFRVNTAGVLLVMALVLGGFMDDGFGIVLMLGVVALWIGLGLVQVWALLEFLASAQRDDAADASVSRHDARDS